LVVAALLVIGWAGVFAQGPGPRHGFGGGQFLGGMAKHLNLTDEQKAEIRKILEAERELMKPVHEQLRENRQALNEVTKDGQFNEAQVTKLAEQQGDLVAQTIVSRERVQAQIWQLLTPEQREKASQVRERTKDRMQGGERPMRFEGGPRRGR